MLRSEIPARAAARFWTNVDQRGPTECWPWTLSTGSHGYGQVGWRIGGQRVMRLAHRVAYVLAAGTIPAGMTVDHNKDVCPIGTICCNPAHLRLLPNVENARDNNHSRKTHCPQGHPYDAVNTRVRYAQRGQRWRHCRECDQQRERKTTA